MKALIIFQISLLTLFFGCKGRLAKEPSAIPYNSIEESKKNNAFVAELRPQQPFVEIEGQKHFITAAWIEHPHIQKNDGNEIAGNIYCYVMELEYNPNLNIDLSEYIEELGNGSWKVWSFLTDGREKNDFIKLHYRSKISQENMDKVFVLYKK